MFVFFGVASLLITEFMQFSTRASKTALWCSLATAEWAFMTDLRSEETISLLQVDRVYAACVPPDHACITVRNLPGLRRRFRRVGPVRGARRHGVEGRADRRRRFQRLHAVVADADRRGIGHAPHAPMRLLTAINALLGAVVLG